MYIGGGLLVIILIVALVIFGPGRLPEIGSALGRGIRDFKKSFDGAEDDPKKVEANSTDSAPKA